MTREEWHRAVLMLRATLNKLWPGGMSAEDRADSLLFDALNRLTSHD
jgi:hypothetical protein